MSPQDVSLTLFSYPWWSNFDESAILCWYSESHRFDLRRLGDSRKPSCRKTSYWAVHTTVMKNYCCTDVILDIDWKECINPSCEINWLQEDYEKQLIIFPWANCEIFTALSTTTSLLESTVNCAPVLHEHDADFGSLDRSRVYSVQCTVYIRTYTYLCYLSLHPHAFVPRTYKFISKLHKVLK